MSNRSRSIDAEELTGLVISLPTPDVTADNDEIVRLASLTRRAKFTDQDQAELDCASDFDRILVVMPSKLIDGKRISVCSANPKALERVRSLAQHLSATGTQFYDRLVGMPAIVFDPPSRQKRPALRNSLRISRNKKCPATRDGAQRDHMNRLEQPSPRCKPGLNG